MEKLKKEVKFTIPLSEEERIEAERKGAHENSIKIAKALLLDGFNTLFIFKTTGLSQTEIENLKQKVKSTVPLSEEERIEAEQKGAREASIEIAKALLLDGFNTQALSEISGLSQTEIENQNNIQNR